MQQIFAKRIFGWNRAKRIFDSWTNLQIDEFLTEYKNRSKVKLQLQKLHLFHQWSSSNHLVYPFYNLIESSIIQLLFSGNQVRVLFWQDPTKLHRLVSIYLYIYTYVYLRCDNIITTSPLIKALRTFRVNMPSTNLIVTIKQLHYYYKLL